MHEAALSVTHSWTGQRARGLAEAQILLLLLAVLPQQPKVAARGLEARFMERGERALPSLEQREKDNPAPPRTRSAVVKETARDLSAARLRGLRHRPQRKATALVSHL
jgi:hypothetical protein